MGDTSEAIAWARRYEQIGEHEFILEYHDEQEEQVSLSDLVLVHILTIFDNFEE